MGILYIDGVRCDVYFSIEMQIPGSADQHMFKFLQGSRFNIN